MAIRHFLTLLDLTSEEIVALIDRATELGMPEHVFELTDAEVRVRTAASLDLQEEKACTRLRVGREQRASWHLQVLEDRQVPHVWVTENPVRCNVFNGGLQCAPKAHDCVIVQEREVLSDCRRGLLCHFLECALTAFLFIGQRPSCSLDGGPHLPQEIARVDDAVHSLIVKDCELLGGRNVLKELRGPPVYSSHVLAVPRCVLEAHGRTVVRLLSPARRHGDTGRGWGCVRLAPFPTHLHPADRLSPDGGATTEPT